MTDIDEMDFDALHHHALASEAGRNTNINSFRHPAMLIETRRVLNMTRKQFAHQVGTTSPVLKAIELGERLATDDHAFVAEVLFLDYLETS